MAKSTDFKETTLVRMLNYALGVNPAEFGVLPDQEGFVAIKELVKAFQEEEGLRYIRESLIRQAAERIAPEEIEVRGKAVRAVTRKPFDLPEEDPPGELYYAARRKAYPHIRRKGLAATPVSPVVLAANKEWALRLGKRRDQEPVLITVAAGLAASSGVIFRRFGEVLYLCDWLPKDCLTGPAVPEDATKKPAKKPRPEKKPLLAIEGLPDPGAMPGGYTVTPEDLEKPYKKKGIKKDIAWKRERRKGRRQKNQD